MKFRTQALTELDSPEQLDQSAKVATVPGWLATAALLVVVLSAGTWAVFGSVAQTFTAAGVLTHSAGVSQLDSTSTGQVTQVWASPNQRMSQGDPLYSIQDTSGAIHLIKSPWTAYVLNWLVAQGQMLAPGSQVANLERLDTPGDMLGVRVYVDASSAPQLFAGQSVDISSSDAPASVFGTMRGTVLSVGSFSETEQSLQAFLGANKDVSSYLAHGSVIAVTVALRTDDTSPSGLWWSKASPPYRLASQSQVTATFTVSTQHPISWLLG